MKVLVADDDSDLRFILRTAVESQGHVCTCAEDGAQAAEIFEELQPDLVISDFMMPGTDGLELLRRIRGISADSIVIMLTGCGKEEVAIEALRLRANNYLVKPVRMDELISLVGKYEKILNDRRLEQEVLGMVLRREFTMQFDNRLEIVPKVADQLVRETGTVIDPDARFGVHLGLYEILVNAIEHGNLGITFEEKAAALDVGVGELKSLYRSRLADPEIARRRVLVEFYMDHKKCEWTITDEGDGFDYENLPGPLRDGVSDSLNGRGIFLTKFQFDEVEYLGRGNRVKLVKKLG